MIQLICASILVLLMGCSKDPSGKQFSDLRTQPLEFGPTVPDRTISTESLNHFSLSTSLGVDASQKNQTPWIVNSAEILRLAENSFLLGENRSRAQYKNHLENAHKVLNLFYSNKENATQFDSNSSMYLHAALGFEGERIFDKLKAVGSPDDTIKLKALFATPCLPDQQPQTPCHSLKWPEQNPTLQPQQFILSISAYLKQTLVRMKELGVSKEFVSAVEGQLKTEYLDKLEHASDLLKDVDASHPLIQNTNSLVTAVEYLSFLPAKILQKLKTDLTRGNSYAEVLVGKRDFQKEQFVSAQQNESSKSNPKDEVKVNEEHGLRVLNIIGNIWGDLNSDQRTKYIRNASEALYDGLSKQSEPFIMWIAGKISISEYKDMCNGWLGCKEEAGVMSSLYRSRYVEGLAKSCHGDVKIQLDRWLKNTEYREELRRNDPRLYMVFTSFQDSTLRDTVLANYKHEEEEITENGQKRIRITQQEFVVPWTVGRDVVRAFNKKLESICIESVQTKIETALNNYILASLDAEIRKYTVDIEKIVADKIVVNQAEVAQGTTSLENFKTYFEKKATPEMDKMFFKGQTLPAIENSKVQMVLHGDTWKTQRTDPSVFETGAETVGVALAANYHKILSLPEIAKVDPNSTEYYTSVFSQINKMLAMIGFRKIDKSLQTSLNRRFLGSIPELDVYKYDCSVSKKDSQDRKRQMFVESKSPDDLVDWREYCEGFENSSSSYFGFPDRLAIQNVFEAQDHVFPELTSSALGQAEIIRGGSLMLKYFTDWKGKDFDYDRGLGKLQFSGVGVFPKHAFVNLTIALSTIPIRSLRKPSSSLFLFDLMGQELHDWQTHGLPPANSPNPIALAAFADMLQNGPSREIHSLDLARFIMAVDEFLTATDGIEYTSASVINPPHKTVKENLQNILDGRRLLKLMVAGVSNFLISRFQASDGGFWHTYNLDLQSNIPDRVGRLSQEDQPRSLQDQVYVIEALLKAHDIWKGTGTLIAALDAYNYMNQKLYNSATGIYDSAEGVSLSLRPHDYLQTLIVLNRIKEIHTKSESRAQAARLYDFYEKAWLDWFSQQKM